jgi:hypothetical protein
MYEIIIIGELNFIIDYFFIILKKELIIFRINIYNLEKESLMY